MTPETPQPLAAIGPWALLLFAVASLALVCSGCHHTSVTCHGPVTVEAAVDAQAGIKGACRAACECDRGECMGCTEIEPLSPEQFDVLRAHHAAAPQYDPRDTCRGHGCPRPCDRRTGCGLKVD